MSGFYHQRPYVGGGPIAKKPRMGPRGPPHMMPGHHPEDDNKRLMSFKEFILAQSNDINEQEALARYSEYKTGFTRKRIDDFFKEHQEEEWFRTKYRPIELKKIEEATKESKARRKELYSKLIEKQSTDNFFLDYQHNETLAQFLENFSLLLEGASMEELDDHEARRKYGVSSIFIPQLHPSIDKAMIEEYAQQHPGFLRVAMSEAQPDKGFRRRAWITYKLMEPDEIRKLCWDYNAHKFNGHETKAIVNKEMNNRIRYTQYWFCHSKAAKADLKNIAKILTHFDGEDSPLLETIKDHLIEEKNEEEQLLGVNEQNAPDFEFTQDPELFKALDKVILYLRIVHSYDYYAATEYTGEDDMPQRIGIMFARPMLPTSFGDQPQELLKEFIEAQKTRVDQSLEKPTLSEAEQKQLGMRNADEEVENFIYQHTIEKKAGEKYLCKLTKKKFTAPEYVRKHILSRCTDKVDEVRTMVEFFNNYVADAKRPM
uniref:Serrate RNA effector molecule homolog n=1 Tax=Aceria tosichella TaxID=561515 RepID=A0A6G1SFV1_9ACAR